MLERAYTGAAILLKCNEVTGTIYTVDAAGPCHVESNASRLTTAVGDMQRPGCCRQIQS
jgi:hypothetical protein